VVSKFAELDLFAGDIAGEPGPVDPARVELRHDRQPHRPELGRAPTEAADV
jgi:hypothetical protein